MIKLQSKVRQHGVNILLPEVAERTLLPPLVHYVLLKFSHVHVLGEQRDRWVLPLGPIAFGLFLFRTTLRHLVTRTVVVWISLNGHKGRFELPFLRSFPVHKL